MDEPEPLNLKATVGSLTWTAHQDYELWDAPELRENSAILVGSEPGTRIVPSGLYEVRRYTILAGGRARVDVVVPAPHTSSPLTEEGPGPFLDLANAARTRPIRKDAQEKTPRDAAISFSKKWGLLSSAQTGSLKSFLSAARSALKVLEIAGANDWRLPPDAHYTLGGLTLGSDGALQANTLAQFCSLGLILATTDGVKLFKCPAPGCGKYGLEREPGRTGPDRMHCNDACRKKAARARPA
jgi:hypothetical protein